MAVLGRWTGGEISNILPSTTWGSPAGLFPTEERNDDSAYSFDSNNSRITLPVSNLADGYLIVSFFEFEDTSNGRHNPQGRMIQDGGSGNFVGQASTGYNRDSSEDRSYVRCFGFVDSPSAGATISFQWRRDNDAPTGGTVRSSFEAIPLYYSNVGVYSSAFTTSFGTDTPERIGGFSVVEESDTNTIEIFDSEVSLRGSNKRYLCLGGAFWQGIGSSRTQRVMGFRVDGVADTETFAYSYGRNSSNSEVGGIFTTIIETGASARTLDLFSYRGDAIGAFPNFGASVAGNTIGSLSQHSIVVMELSGDAEVFKSGNASQQSLATAGAVIPVDATPADGIELADSESFARANDRAMSAQKSIDAIVGANIFGGYTSNSTQRATCFADLTVDGARLDYTGSGNFGRGSQGSQACYGWGANLLSAVALDTGEEIGIDAGKIAGGESGTVAILDGYTGFWGINLDSLSVTAPPRYQILIDNSVSSSISENLELQYSSPNFSVVVDDSEVIVASENLTVSASSQVAVFGSTSLVVSENAIITYQPPTITAVVEDSAHIIASDSVIMTSRSSINIDDSAILSSSDFISISLSLLIQPEDGEISVISSDLEIVAALLIEVDGSAHVLTSEAVTLTTDGALSIDGSVISHSSESLRLSANSQLFIDSGIINSFTDTVQASSSAVIDTNSSAILSFGDEINVYLSGVILIDNSAHTLQSDQVATVAIFEERYVIINEQIRFVTVEGFARFFCIESENI